MAELILYKKCKINPNENFIVKQYFGNTALDDYLATLSLLKFSDVRFTQNKLDIEVIVKLSRDDSDMANRSEYNYVSLQEKTGATIFYYFITKMAQISPQSVKLYLHLDVLNTFAITRTNDGVSGFLKFSKLTHITRQHKDRFKPNVVYGQGTFYAPHIDEYSEGLNPVLYKKSERVIKEELADYLYDLSWYLMYTTDDNGNVLCRLIGEPTDLLFRWHGDPQQGELPVYYTSVNDINNFQLTNNKIIKIIKLPYLPAEIIETGIVEEDPNQGHDGKPYIQLNENDWRANVFTDTGGVHDTPTLFNNKLSISLINDYSVYDDIIALNPLCNKTLNNVSKSLTDLRASNLSNIWHEPKLFHSDFYYNKYIYDSFVKVIKNESYLNDLMTLEEYADYKNIIFYMTSTINSRFMFNFSFLKKFHFNNEDYENILVIQRNNEVTIYNNDYINYIKTGFNYDVKNKNRQEAFSWFTTGVGLTAGLLSVVFGSKTIGAGLIASSVLSIASSINNTIQLETNMEQKIAQLKNQSSSVYGADDVDLMTNYSKNNKLWVAKYEVSDRMKNALDNLFYYTGYIDDVCEVPNVSTRKWFNFLQCEPHFDYVNNISAECLEELINKYKGGVTYLHMNTINNVKTWDFDRTHENWESVFFS